MENLKTLLIRHGVSLKKAFGQNFLTDDSLLKEIVEASEIDNNVNVLEIGPGAGALTRYLCATAKKVVAYEIDSSLAPVLKETVGNFSNLEIVYKDVLKEKLSDIEEKLGGEYVMVANLPYYITTPIIMKFLENSEKIKGLVVMVQKEVAERFCAKPKTSEYGAITVAINLRGYAKIIKTVPREKFTPAPNVDSAVVKIIVNKTSLTNEKLKSVRNVVRTAFSNRRKMLVNNLMSFYKTDRNTVENLLVRAEIPLKARAEELSAEQFIKLSELSEAFNG